MQQGQTRGPSTGMIVGIAIFAAVIVSLGVGFFVTIGGPSVGRAVSGTGVVGVEVAGDLGIEVDAAHNAINFGTLSRGGNADTLPPVSGDGNMPFLIRNMGNLKADVEVCAVSLWNGPSKTPADYQFSVADADPRVAMDNCISTPCFNKPASPASPTPMPLSCPVGILAVNDLNFEDNNDEAIIHAYVHVPTDEPAGAKSSVVTFSAVSSTAYA